uniref:Uncharacterized protein n=1 Tax=Timema tahoe TaxID=61484 RepID=A0A7R9FJM5_9NEOP|nr:unnamed protein product [Timema tahoe]
MISINDSGYNHHFDYEQSGCTVGGIFSQMDAEQVYQTFLLLLAAGSCTRVYGVAFSILSKMVAAVPVYMNTQDKFREMEQFWKQNSEKLGTAARSFQQAMETIQGNINWKNTSYHELEVWLSRNNEGLSTT